MSNPKPELLIAAALYEMRLLLAPYLGSENTAELPVRTAAHLAYALHNEAEALLHGKSFQVGAALARVEAIDRVLGAETNLVERLAANSRGAEASNFMSELTGAESLSNLMLSAGGSSTRR